MLLVPQLERGVLDRRGRGDAGIVDDDVEAAEGERRVVEARRSTAASSVTSSMTPRDDVLAEALAEARRRAASSALCVDVGEHDAGALAQQPRARSPRRCRRRRR